MSTTRPPSAGRQGQGRGLLGHFGHFLFVTELSKIGAMGTQTEFGAFEWQEPCWVSEPIAAPVLKGALVQIQCFSEREEEPFGLPENESAALRRFFSCPPRDPLRSSRISDSIIRR